MLKWFAIPFSSGPRFVKTLHRDPSILGDPTRMACSFIESDKAVTHVISLVSFLLLCIYLIKNVVSPNFWVILICMKYFSMPSFSVCVCLQLRSESFVNRVSMGRVFLSNQSTLCLLMGAFSPLTFKVVVSLYLAPVSCFLFVFVVLCSSSFSFLPCSL